MTIDIEKLDPKIRNNPTKLGAVIISDKLLDQLMKIEALKDQLAKVQGSNTGIEYSSRLDELFEQIKQL